VEAAQTAYPEIRCHHVTGLDTHARRPHGMIGAERGPDVGVQIVVTRAGFETPGRSEVVGQGGIGGQQTHDAGPRRGGVDCGAGAVDHGGEGRTPQDSSWLKRQPSPVLVKSQMSPLARSQPVAVNELSSLVP
jgi:hypothetical protein